MRLMKERRLPPGLPGSRVGQPGHAEAHEQAGHGRRRRPRRPPVPARPGSRWPASSSSATRARPPSSIEETFRARSDAAPRRDLLQRPLSAARLDAVRAAGRPRRRRRLERGERGHVRLPLRVRHGLAAAPHRRDHGGLRAARRREQTRCAPARRPPASCGARATYLSSRSSLSVGSSKALRAARGQRARAGACISNCARPLRMANAHLGRRDVGIEGERVVAQQTAVLAPLAHVASADPGGERRAGQRIGHRQPQVVERQRAWRSAACRARCRRSRRGSTR